MAIQLPLVLIGPILRRVERSSVSVFIATSEAAHLGLNLYEGFVNPGSGNQPLPYATTASETTAFCAHFHATVITLTIPDGKQLLPGNRYSYDLSFVTLGQPRKSLADLDMLVDREVDDVNAPRQKRSITGLGYREGQLPSFVTVPADLEDLVLVQASCRKPHGIGHPALQYLDTLIETVEDGDKPEAGRPHMLLLTGDQIYADDVALALLPGISSLAIALMGGAIEQVPAPVAGASLTVTDAVLPAGFRQKLTGQAGFTSSDASCHLIGFGEWLAMYCIAWNPELWPVLGVAWHAADRLAITAPQVELSKELLQRLHDDATNAPSQAPDVLVRPSPDSPQALLSDLYGTDQEAAKALADAFGRFIDHKDKLGEFAAEVGHVRRLLANVPVYMICDDHDVTDDWFMTAGIRAATTGDPFGKALLRNALAAYAICQAWGDDPVRWASGPRSELLGNIPGMYANGEDAAAKVAEVLGLSAGGHPQFDFSFRFDGPQFRLCVLDTRTRRRYDGAAAAPGLLTPDALGQQLPAEPLPDGHVLIVVSPAPVFGPPLIAELGGVLAASVIDLQIFAARATRRAARKALTGLEHGKPTGEQAFDAEHWGIHPEAFEDLLARLSLFSRVVVLAGDVHYGAAYAMDWTGSGRTSRIVHLTCSPARNAWEERGVRNLMSLNGMAVGLQRIGLPAVRLGWRDQPPGLDPQPDLATEPPLARLRLSDHPVLLSDELFRHRYRLENPPDWVWQANPIVDGRPAADRPRATNAGELRELPDENPVHHFGDLMAAHVAALDTLAIARGVQFLNNVGVVRFVRRQDGGGLGVSQSLISLRAHPETSGEQAADYIVHEAALEPVQLPMPAFVGRA